MILSILTLVWLKFTVPQFNCDPDSCTGSVSREHMGTVYAYCMLHNGPNTAAGQAVWSIGRKYVGGKEGLRDSIRVSVYPTAWRFWVVPVDAEGNRACPSAISVWRPRP